MKIFKTVIASLSDDVQSAEKKTQRIIDELFEKYPNGKIEDWKFQHVISQGNYQYFSIALLFETEPKEEKELNPLLIHQIISEIKGE